MTEMNHHRAIGHSSNAVGYYNRAEKRSVNPVAIGSNLKHTGHDCHSQDGRKDVSEKDVNGRTHILDQFNDLFGTVRKVVHHWVMANIAHWASNPFNSESTRIDSTVAGIGIEPMTP